MISMSRCVDVRRGELRLSRPDTERARGGRVRRPFPSRSGVSVSDFTSRLLGFQQQDYDAPRALRTLFGGEIPRVVQGVRF